MEVREDSLGPPGCPGVVRRPTRKTGRGREAHPVVREESMDPLGRLGDPPEGSGGPLRGLGGVGWQTGGPGGVNRATWRNGRGREVQPEVREAHPYVQQGSGVLPGDRGGVGRPT